MRIAELAKKVRHQPGRDVFGGFLEELGEENQDVVVVAADAAGSMRCTKFSERFPDRAVNVGIAEQNQVGIGAGLALAGKLPLVMLYGFLVARAAEQIRTDVCYPNLNVKIITTATGFAMGEGGATHNCMEDLGILRTLANLTIVQPASALETCIAGRTVITDLKGPVFLRISRLPYWEEAEKAAEDYYLNGGKFEVGKAIQLRHGKDVTLIGSGLMVGVTLQAAQLLEKEGISARVLNMHTVKPLDKQAILDAASATKGIVTVENHNVLAGLGEGVCGVVCDAQPVRVRRVGIPDTYCEIGPYDELCKHYGLSSDNVANVAQGLVSGGTS